MFCPECGKPLPDVRVRVCPHCNTAFEIPEQPAVIQSDTHCKRSTAALLLGVGTFVFGMLTLLGKLLNFDFKILYGTSAITFFLAPLACCFGLSGIVARMKSREKRGLPSAIIGLLFGLVFGLLAAYCLVMRVFRA